MYQTKKNVYHQKAEPCFWPFFILRICQVQLVHNQKALVDIFSVVPCIYSVPSLALMELIWIPFKYIFIILKHACFITTKFHTNRDK